MTSFRWFDRGRSFAASNTWGGVILNHGIRTLDAADLVPVKEYTPKVRGARALRAPLGF